ncbi:hypothetical protein NE237_029712 [Protea cynaroides]|uniref:Uncharacterized protein n=1 Tax=Protea cynaroides TaxID=273540 RepID=A0A9Q0JWB7_9MAGN|nr:hypothetical protein NE237_029712 [Protea cynaroides]
MPEEGVNNVGSGDVPHETQIPRNDDIGRWADVEEDDDPDTVKEGELHDVVQVITEGRSDGLSSDAKYLALVARKNGEDGNVSNKDADNELVLGDQTDSVAPIRTIPNMVSASVTTTSPGTVEVLFEDIATVDENLSMHDGEFSQVGKRLSGCPPERGKNKGI